MLKQFRRRLGAREVGAAWRRNGSISAGHAADCGGIARLESNCRKDLPSMGKWRILMPARKCLRSARASSASSAARRPLEHAGKRITLITALEAQAQSKTRIDHWLYECCTSLRCKANKGSHARCPSRECWAYAVLSSHPRLQVVCTHASVEWKPFHNKPDPSSGGKQHEHPCSGCSSTIAARRKSSASWSVGKEWMLQLFCEIPVAERCQNLVDRGED